MDGRIIYETLGAKRCFSVSQTDVLEVGLYSTHQLNDNEHV